VSAKKLPVGLRPQCGH